MRRLAFIGLVLGLLALGLVRVFAPSAPPPMLAAGAAQSPADAVDVVAPPRVARAEPSSGPAPDAESPPAPDAAGPLLADAAGEPTAAFVRDMLDDAIAAHLPSHKLSPDDLDRLTDAVVELRAAQQEMRELPWEPEHAARRKLLLARVAGASQTFEEVLDMDLADFSAAVQPGVGIDRDDGPVESFEPAGEAGFIDAGEPEFLEPR